MNVQLAVPKELACVNIIHRRWQLVYESDREAVAGVPSGGDKIGFTRDPLVELCPTLFKYENKRDMGWDDWLKNL